MAHAAVPSLLRASRYLILVPIVGLGLAAAIFFVAGGISLIRLALDVGLTYFGLREGDIPHDPGVLIFEVVEHVHLFLVGTVLYITAVGLYQLFIREIDFHGWLRIESTEDLESNLVGVTVVVLAVDFMGAVFAGNQNILQYGAAIALPIAALGVFMGLRAWAAKQSRSSTDRANARHGAADDRPPGDVQGDDYVETPGE
jgi:uncharacterized membrane protein YqhA